MTREQLERYHDITVRLKMLTSTIVTDTVNGSSDEFPYTTHPISIRGTRRDTKAIEEVKLLVQEKSAIDEYIDGIEDVRARTLLDMHYRKGWGWCKVAHSTGKSMEANHLYLYRFFKQCNIV